MKPKVLFGVLNWGLGHATRSIPIINYLIKNDYEVHIASDGDSLEYLKHEFPLLNFYTLHSYNVKYPFKSIFFNLALSSISIITAIIKEYFFIKKLSKKFQPDIIISDNRYGFRADSIKSIIITHQVNLQLSNRLISGLARYLIGKFLKKFNEVWIPDYKDNLLAGKLSGCNRDINCKFIGPLSRLKKQEEDQLFEIAVIISGPEPQRTKFEHMILKQFEEYHEEAIIVLGNINKNENYMLNEKVLVKSHVFSEELNDILNKSNLVISRSGYSSIMDYVVLDKKAILIPTPGQLEQEYLAGYLKNAGFFYSVDQQNFDIERDLSEINNYSKKIVMEEKDYVKLKQLLDSKI